MNNFILETIYLFVNNLRFLAVVGSNNDNTSSNLNYIIGGLIIIVIILVGNTLFKRDGKSS